MSNWTATDLKNIDRAIATGASKVRFADGREVTNRSLSDLWAIRREIEAAVSGASNAGSRVTFVEHSRD